MKALPITLTLITLGTIGLSGGAAMADDHYDNHRVEVRRDVPRERREVRVEHYRDFHARPSIRIERHVDRVGFRWVGGEWRWSGYEWIWAPGYYVRIARW